MKHHPNKIPSWAQELQNFGRYASGIICSECLDKETKYLNYMFRKWSKYHRMEVIYRLLFSSRSFDNLVLYYYRDKLKRPLSINPRIKLSRNQVYSFKLKKKSGGYRKITAYRREAHFVAVKLLWLLEHLILPKPLNIIYGGRKNHSVGEVLHSLDGRLNKGVQYLYKTDISNYFPSINRRKLSGQLSKYIPSSLINLIMKIHKLGSPTGLVQGSTLSVLLANFYLSNLLNSSGLTEDIYVYIDDILIVSDTERRVNELQNKLTVALNKGKLKENHCKREWRRWTGILLKGLDYLGFNLQGNQWHRHNIPIWDAASGISVKTWNKTLVETPSKRQTKNKIQFRAQILPCSSPCLYTLNKIKFHFE